MATNERSSRGTPGPDRAQKTKKPPKRSVTLHVRVDEELAEQVQALALAEDRTVSYFIARILRQYVESKNTTKTMKHDEQ
jgi:ribbon-helix-helix CopG family protein